MRLDSEPESPQEHEAMLALEATVRRISLESPLLELFTVGDHGSPFHAAAA